jgi:hypothetical protein
VVCLEPFPECSTRSEETEIVSAYFHLLRRWKPMAGRARRDTPGCNRA